jgi:hypothetical protein
MLFTSLNEPSELSIPAQAMPMARISLSDTLLLEKYLDFSYEGVGGRMEKPYRIVNCEKGFRQKGMVFRKECDFRSPPCPDVYRDVVSFHIPALSSIRIVLLSGTFLGL